MTSTVELTCTEDGKTTFGQVERRDLPANERAMRSLKVLGILWVVAFITIFVPVLHFVLVPLFLLLGIVFATTTWMEKSWIVKGSIPCPNCNKSIEFKEESESWPSKQRCPSCSFMLTISDNAPVVKRDA